MQQESTILMSLCDYLSKLLSEGEYVRIVKESAWRSGDGTYLTSLSEIDSYLKSKGISTQPSELKFWEYSKGTQTLTLGWHSGRTIRLQREQRQGTQTGVSSMELSAVSEQSQKSGSKSSDPISPSHYQNHKGWDIIEFTEHLNFNRGNAIKYLFRAGKKDKSKELEDLKKALWYVQREIARISGV